MRYILIVLFTLLYGSSSPQVDFTQAYYPFINRAELAIIKEDYSGALTAYDSAFIRVKKPYARDYINAAVSAIKAQQFMTAFRYCDSLISKGVEKDFFTSFGSFQPLWKTKEGAAFINGYEAKKKQFLRSKDTTLTKVFKEMSDLDQEFRKKPGSYRTYGDTIRKIDSNNIAQLQFIIKTYGFPNENMVNLDDPLLINFPTYIVFHHHGQSMTQSKEEKYNFLPDYVNAVKKGELDPHRFAYLLDLQGDRSLPLGGWGVSTCLIGGERGKLLGNKYTVEMKTKIDQIRHMYGLESIDDFYRKAVFALRDDRAKEFAFEKYSHINLLEMASNEECEKFMAVSLVLE